MKKYALFVFILTFIFGLFALNANSASAYDPGCTSAGPYSVTTGQLCYPSSSYGQSAYGQPNYSIYQELGFGSVGQDVITLQQLLQNKGYSVGRIDGIFGLRTQSAVISYQRTYGLPMTGRADAQTWASLNVYSPIYPTYPPTYPPTNPYYSVPTISRVSGPQTLSVNQQGTWTVTAFSSSGGNLSYSVSGGDYPVPMYLNTSPTYSSQQSATFTHTYLQAGTYTPIFTVTNQNGQNASSSLSVTVGGIVTNQIPTVYYLAPNYGYVGTQVTIYGSGFVYSGNTVNFGGTIIPNLNLIPGNPYYSNSSAITFTVPQVGTIYCIQAPCTQNFNVSVSNLNGTSSNSTVFTVLY